MRRVYGGMKEGVKRIDREEEERVREEGLSVGVRDKGGQICGVRGTSTPHLHQLHMYINSTCTSTGMEVP